MVLKVLVFLRQNMKHQENYHRNHTLDVLRGFIILGMVFFTVIYQIANDLPDVLTHNVAGQAHIGDFVLSLFIFASGISAAYFIEKRKNKSKLQFALDMLERAALLIGISFLLSPVSSGHPFGMDEISLAAIMFIFSVAFFAIDSRLYALFSIILIIFYAFIVQNFGVAFFDKSNLGGYQGALFYLPVMLAGLAIGKQLVKGNIGIVLRVAYAAFIIYAITLFFFPIDKLRVSPPFMFASVILGILLYILFDFLMQRYHVSFSFFNYLGKRPLRYWVLMWIFFMFPLALYYSIKGAYTLRIFEWQTAFLISIAILLALAILSFLLDMALLFFRTKSKGR